MNIREAGRLIGKLPPGSKNCITDVEGVMVGHKTLDFPLDELREDHPIMNQLFAGAAEAAEEAIMNSLPQAVSTKGRAGRVVQKIPL
jgi:L-aminopeptidase/D-esterase-like protein